MAFALRAEPPHDHGATGSLGVLTRGRSNNFLLLRLMAAMLVMWHHAWALTKSEGEPLRALGFEPGQLGVTTFFCVSGFLVTQSVQRRSPWDFLCARAARIFPGLWVSLLVCAFVLGPLVTTLDLGSYLAHPRLLQFLVGNGTMLSPRFDLPAVFENAPYPYAVNGSLWTLPYEIACYVGLLLAARRLHSRAGARLFVISVLALIVWMRLDDERWLLVLEGTPFRPQHFHLFLFYFLIGGVAAVWADRIPVTPRLALLATGIAIASVRLPLAHEAVFPFAYSYAILAVACWRMPGQDLINRQGDYSYGVFIYSMPVQQLIIHWHPGAGPLVVMGASLALAFIPAIASWHLVERPALLKVRAFRGRARVPSPTVLGAEPDLAK